MANLYHVHKFGIRIKEGRSFPPRKKTDRNLFYNRSFFEAGGVGVGGGGGWKHQFLSAIIPFPTLTVV